MSVPIGTIITHAGPNTPSGYLYCDGSALRSVDYAALYSEIGTTYGSGTGVGGVDFNIPDYRGRGHHCIGGTSALALGDQAGSLTSEHDHGAGTLASSAHSHGAGSLAVDSHEHGPGSFAASHTHTLGGSAALAGAVPLLGGTISTESPAVTGTSGSASPSVSGSTGDASPGISGSVANASPSVLHPVMGVRFLIYAGI